MSRASQWKALLVQHYYTPVRIAQLEKTVKNVTTPMAQIYVCDCIFWPKRGFLGPLAATKGPNTRSKCVVTMSPTQLDQRAAVGTKSGSPGLSEDLQGPQKGPFGPKRAPFGAPGVPQRSLKRPKHMMWMQPTQLDQPVAVGTKSGPTGCPGPQKGPFWAKTGPFWGPRGAVGWSKMAYKHVLYP